MKSSSSMFNLAVISLALFLFVGLIYTIIPKQVITKNFGGSMDMQVQPNHKVVNVTWKNNDLWILTRPMKENEEVETYTFKEFSTFGVLQGTVNIKEQKK